MFLSAARRFCRRFLPALVALLSCGPSFGALTDLADNPLSSATTATVKPNIFFILDDSGSMNWRFMPDAMSSREDRIGFRNNQCNLVYYNPASRYVVPKTSAGTDVNAGTPTAFTAAYDDGFGAYKGLETRTSSDSGATWTAWSATGSCTADTSGTSRRDCRIALLGSAGATTNLSTSFRAFVDGTIDGNSATSKIDTAQPAYYWKYAGATTLIPTQGDCEKVLSPSYTVNNATYASGKATFTTSAAHNFVAGNTVAVINIQPSGYRGTYSVFDVPTATTFRVNLASNPGGYTNSGTAWNATRYATVNEYCTDNTTTTSTCAAAGKTALWQKVIVGATSGPATVDVNGDGAVNSSDQDERQNFANWYSYYSKRINMMKSASGRAFVGMTDSKRIGFVTINPGSPVSTQKFRPIADFDTTTKEDWFNTLYATTTGSSTPLRQALSRAGRYYAGKLDGINTGMFGDPVQYSCQQNFGILTTDGYWNGSAGEQLLGATAIGNQDGVISEQDAYRPAGSKYAMSPRPIFDGASTTYTWNTATQTFQTASCLRQEKKLAQEQERKGEWEQQTSQQQKTLGQVQYKTNLQTGPAQLQYSSNLESNTGQLQLSSRQQRRIGPLEYSSNIVKNTGQLEGRTTQQRKVGQLQYSSNFLQNTGQLQYRTNLQKKTGQLQFASTIQKRTGQLQFSTNLQKQQGQLQTRTSANSGGTWTGWSNVSTCTEDSGNPSLRECRINPVATFAYVTPAAPTCTPTRTGSAGSYAWTGNASAVDCQTAAFTAPANTSVTCTANANTVCSISGPGFAPAQSCTSNVSGSTWTPAGTNGNATTECLTGQPLSSWVDVTSGTCTDNAAVDCQITGSFTYVTAAAPTCVSNVSGSTYTAAGALGSATVECSTLAGFNSWIDNSTCNENANFQCQVLPGAQVMVQTCTPSRTGSAGSYAWTGGASAVSCLANPGFGSTWLNASTCTEVAGTMACRQDPAAVFAYDTTFPLPACTQTRSGTAGSYVWTGGATATLCQTAAFNPSWTPTSTCTESAAVQCQVAAGTQVANQQTCTFSRTGSAGSYAWTGGASAVSCLNTGTVGAAWAPSTGNCTWTTGAAQIQCRIEPSTPWVYDTVSPQPSCTATGGGTSNGNVWTNSGGNVTLCQTSAGFNTTWTPTPTCQESTNLQCRVDPSGTKAMVQTCTGVYTRSGSAGSYLWTGGASARDCAATGAANLGTAWASATTCQEAAGMQCRVDPVTAHPWSYVATYPPTCTPGSRTAGGLWSGGASAVDCRTDAFNPVWTNNSVCTEGPTVQCQINGSTFGAPNADCASQTRTGSAGSYAYTGGASANYCETAVTSPFAYVNYACAPATTPDASGYTTQCQFVGSILNPTPTWADYTAGGACVPDAITDCRTVDVTGWVVSDVCNPVVTPDATGKTTQCRNTATRRAVSTGFVICSFMAASTLRSRSPLMAFAVIATIGIMRLASPAAPARMRAVAS